MEIMCFIGVRWMAALVITVVHTTSKWHDKGARTKGVNENRFFLKIMLITKLHFFVCCVLLRRAWFQLGFIATS